MVLAAFALRRELTGLDAGEVIGALRADGTTRLALGLAATVASFLALAAIELLALHHVARDAKVPWGTGMVTGFVAHAFSQTIGVALLTGAAVRVRAYRRFALDGPDVARLSVFVTLTVTLGLLATGALAFVESAAPLRVGSVAVAVRPAGVLLGASVLAYLAWSLSGAADTIGIGRWRAARPPAGVASTQVLLAAADWVVTGSILHLAIPSAAGLAYGTTLRVYLVAQTVGSLSHVPGGVGVFELLVLTLLAPLVTPPQRVAVVAGLVAFRVLYYLLPLAVAFVVAGVSELRPKPQPLLVERPARAA